MASSRGPSETTYKDMNGFLDKPGPDTDTDVSSIGISEINRMNSMLGSLSRCHAIGDVGLQEDILGLIPNDLFRSFRRSTHNRPTVILLEDWLWKISPTEFTTALGDELLVLDDILSAFLRYLLNGFMVPWDEVFESVMDKFEENSVSQDNKDRFLSNDVTPGFICRYVYWKLTFMLTGLMRLYSVKDTSEAAKIVQAKIKTGHT